MLNVSWVQDMYMVSESGPPVMACAVIVDGSLERDVSIAVSTMNGTAISGNFISIISTHTENKGLVILVCTHDYYSGLPCYYL